MDSIQGFLEMAAWGREGHVVFCFDLADKDNVNSMYFQILQLEKEKYINVTWEHAPDGYMQLKQISLTVEGMKLLDDLQHKSRFGMLKARFRDLLWIVVTTIITTLIVLKLKGV
jgi:hypothetical protein